jgi:prepilin-type N-terminal cleavage/methylation domain-containing protein
MEPLLLSRSGISRAFTLIELLIVVAIIAILAAIAVPQFAEASARAGVARTAADMRSLATALESYATDHSAYPPFAVVPGNGFVEDPAVTFGDDHFEVFSRRPGFSLTSPIAYITSYPPDRFARSSPSLESPDPVTRAYLPDYSYRNARYTAEIWIGPPEPWLGPGGINFIRSWGHWRLVGAGPDGTRVQDVKSNIIYDPTNGTISRGDIVRTQRRPQSARRDS